MSTASEREQLDRVRQRFTRTAQQFAKFSLTTRSAEAERLVRLAAPTSDEDALDLACGPGTFTWAFAPHVKFIHGLDLTPALLGQARQAAAREGLTNLALVCGEATALPYADSSMDLAVCAYSFHHFGDPARTLSELRRVLRRNGRLAVVDLIVPEGAQAEAHNQIERARDASHVCTLRAGEIASLVESAGFRIRVSEVAERWRSFRDWMQIAGWEPGDPAYAETWRLMEASMPGNAAGFRPRFARRAAGETVAEQDDIEFVQTSFFAVAAKR